MTYIGENHMLTTSGVADMLHLHINTVRRWSDQGILKSYRIGPRGDRRFVRGEVVTFLTSPYAFKNGENEEQSQEKRPMSGESNWTG